ncbi:glycosyltransferase family 2 protein [Candidatus Saccharibacteria bacterium]|nr:glycosyltransferase family 2 protein [Candidatus Saccharibacteria bacterium]
MNQKIILIIPAYNEESSIKQTIESISHTKYDYIVINDGSTDHTATILEENHYHHIDLIMNLGIGGAVQTGYKYAREMGYDIAIQFDADGQHDVDAISDLIQPIIDQSADFTIGSRFINKSQTNFKSSFLRRIGIRLISNIIYLFSRKRIYDTTSGFRAANNKVIEYFAEHYPREYPEPVSDFELIKLGYRFTEVPAKMHERTAGKSSIHSWKSAYYVINVLLSILTLQIRIKRHD